MKTPNPVYWATTSGTHTSQTSSRDCTASDERSCSTSPTGSWRAPIAPSVPDSVRVVLGMRNVGILGYIAGPDVHLTDLLGLADPVAARLILVERSRPGHEKMLPTPGSWRGSASRAARSAPRPRRRGAGNGMRRPGRLLHAVSDPLTPSRFLANIGVAWSLHRLRIPAEPAAAARRFCMRAGRSAAGRPFAG